MAGHRIVSAAVSRAKPTDAELRLQAYFAKLEEQFRQLKEQTRQAQQLASLGTAAAMLAHEINNLLTPVVSYAGYALQAADTELMAKALRLTLKQVDLVTSMADRILGLARHDEKRVQQAPIAAIVADAIAALCRDFSKDGITFKCEVPDHLCVVVDPRQLTQVFFNLILNARQAIQHRQGRITISAARTDGEQVEIRVADNGCGIPRENLGRIFEPFYSTKQHDRPGKSGSGLGLALCRELIAEHGGTIAVASEPGQGTTFTILLPAGEGAESCAEPVAGRAVEVA